MKTHEEYVAQARSVHGDKYEYPERYIDCKTKINHYCNKCKKIFLQSPSGHFNNRNGCPLCKNIHYTTKSFVEKVSKIHGNLYDYSKFVYLGSKIKSTIICEIHGEFLQSPNNHLRGKGCPECGGRKKSNASVFTEKANKLHGNLYDYSKFVYVNSITKGTIICEIHGVFPQSPNHHLNHRHGCPKCAGCEKHTIESFVEKANKAHHSKYDYSNFVYVDSAIKGTIVCPEHGVFLQSPNHHLRCRACYGNEKSTIEKFVVKANIIHNNLYDYSKFVYENNRVKGIIICPEHGEFLQSSHSHLDGQGCPGCKSSFGEKAIEQWLTKNNISFEQERKFDGCKNKRLLSFDFYLPNYNMLIEFDGEQHRRPVSFGSKKINANSLFQYIQLCDKIKNEWAKDNGYKLVRISEIEEINDTLKLAVV